MVSENNIINLISNKLQHLKLLSRGAESELYLGEFFSYPAVFKLRRQKIYMDPVLDSKLRRIRIQKEARIIRHLYDSGVRVPKIYAFFPALFLIVIEYIRGERLKEYIENNSNSFPKILEKVKEAGRQLGLIHKNGIVHGDVTTSNFIVSDNNIYVIDFGLSEYSTLEEDRAVDLHLFKRAIYSTHADKAESLYSAFLEGYREQFRENAEKIIAKAEEISLRGRYVEERRTVWRNKD